MAVARRLVAILCAVLVGAAAQSAGGASSRITDISVGVEDGATRITVDSAGPLRAEVFTLGSPDRLVVDLPVVEWPQNASVRLPKNGLVSNVRFGRFDPKTSRLVMDLRQPAQIVATNARSLDNGRRHRLQLDLMPAAPGQALRGKVTVAASAAGEAITNLTQRSDQASNAAGPVADALAGSPTERLNETVAAALVLPPPRRPDGRTVIAIDAGHGGIDPGAIGARGTTEKTITLAAARELRRQLEASGRFSVVMTRDSDVYVPLRERVEIARSAGAQLFVSLHADQHDSARLRGASIYTLSETASDAETEAYAQRENNSDVVAGVALAEEYDAEVAQILFSLVQQSTMNCSAVFASTLIDEISQHSRMVPKAHRFAGFRVLKAPDVPSVLIELGYLSNREDERLLSSAPHRSKLMRAIARAISLYFDGREC